LLPIPAIERKDRAVNMVATMEELFGPCSQYGECALVCPEEIPLIAVASANKERLKALLAPRV
jgi:succinate dehydrogenase / fumarate reductase iron-sulfur subunit